MIAASLHSVLRGSFFRRVRKFFFAGLIVPDP